MYLAMDASAREKVGGNLLSAQPSSEVQSSLNSLMEAVNRGAEVALDSLKQMLESVKEFAPQLTSILQALLGKEEKTGEIKKPTPVDAQPFNLPPPVSYGPTAKSAPGLTPHEKSAISITNAGKTREEKREEDLNRYAAVGKIPSIERLKAIPDPGKRVVAVAEELMKLDVRGKHCWDWVDVVYYAAKVQRRGVFSSFKDYEGRDCGSHHASKTLVDNLEPGDHIFINNKNGTDKHGNHSVIFMGWEDKERGIARLAQLPRGGKGPPKIMIKDIRHKNPVTFIAKPSNV